MFWFSFSIVQWSAWAYSVGASLPYPFGSEINLSATSIMRFASILCSLVIVKRCKLADFLFSNSPTKGILRSLPVHLLISLRCVAFQTLIDSYHRQWKNRGSQRIVLLCPVSFLLMRYLADYQILCILIRVNVNEISEIVSLLLFCSATFATYGLFIFLPSSSISPSEEETLINLKMPWTLASLSFPSFSEKDMARSVRLTVSLLGFASQIKNTFVTDLILVMSLSARRRSCISSLMLHCSLSNMACTSIRMVSWTIWMMNMPWKWRTDKRWYCDGGLQGTKNPPLRTNRTS